MTKSRKIRRARDIILIIICAVFFLLAHDTVMAQPRNNIDVAIVIDSSGSMKKTDPKSLRIPAAKLFISLLGSNDRAAVLSFSDNAYPITGLTPVNNESNKQSLLNATERISSRGLYTNLYEAFEKGMETLLNSKQEGREQIIVLMSDGMMDVGDTEQDAQLLAKLKSELAENLKKNGIKVYAIAFTDRSDRRLLEKLSKQTGGFYNLASTDKDFNLIFTSIFETLKSPEMLPMEKNGFLVDGSVREVTIVASKESADSEIQIKDPAGQIYSGNKKYSGISWYISDNFDMVTVQKPVGGRWEILYSTGKNNKAYIITDLALKTNFEQLYAMFGENLDIKAWLEKDGSVINEGTVLETTNINIELQNPDGNISNLKPLDKGNGIYFKRITPFQDGNYRLKVIAKGKTFEREKSFLFNVANLQESKEDLKAARTAGRTEQQAKPEDSKEKSPAVDWTKIIIQFISVNIVIALLVVVYLKRYSISDIKLVRMFFKRLGTGERIKSGKKESAASSNDKESKAGPEAAKGDSRTVSGQTVKEKESTEGEDKTNLPEENEAKRERIALEESASEDDADNDNVADDKGINIPEVEIHSLERLQRQDNETKISDNNESDTSKEEQNAESAVEDVNGQPEDKESVENMWEEALKEQTSAESGAELKTGQEEEQKGQTESTDKEDKKTFESGNEEQNTKTAEDETNVQSENDEDVEDMWANALSEQAKSEELSEKINSDVAEQSEGMELSENVDGNTDRLREEALKEQKEEKGSEEESSGDKNNPGDISGASG